MKSSEKTLLAVFATLIAVMGGFILGRQLQNWNHLLDRQARSLELEKMEADSLLRQADDWKSREKWLLEHQPAAESDFEADENLRNTLNAKVAELHLETVKPAQLLNSVKNAYASEHGVAMSVKGDLPTVFRWIYSVQSPSEFRVVPTVKITPDKEDAAKVVCAIEFWRWYRPALATTAPP